jgi:hypothetical protein
MFDLYYQKITKRWSFEVGMNFKEIGFGFHFNYWSKRYHVLNISLGFVHIQIEYCHPKTGGTL